MNDEQLHELLYQALETEIGGIAVYETAIKCAVNEDLKKEWEEYLDQTQHHHAVLESLFGELGLDPSTETPGRTVVRHVGESLVTAMEMALASGPPEAAQLVAGESVVQRRNEGSPQLGIAPYGEREGHRDDRQGDRRGVRRGRRRRRRAPLPHHRMDPRAVVGEHSACQPCCRHPRSRRA